MNNIFTYSFKVWFLAILPCSLIGRVVRNLEKGWIPLKFWEIPGLSIYLREDLVSTLKISFFSIPLFILFYYQNEYNRKRSNSVSQLKKYINFYGLIIISPVMLFLLHGGLVLIITFSILVWMFKIELVETKKKIPKF